MLDGVNISCQIHFHFISFIYLCQTTRSITNLTAKLKDNSFNLYSDRTSEYSLIVNLCLIVNILVNRCFVLFSVLR